MKFSRIQGIALSLVAAGAAFGGTMSLDVSPEKMKLSVSSSYAQTAPQRANTPAKPPSAATPAANPPAEQPATPVRIETIVYDSWTLTCRDNPEKPQKKFCSAEMRVVEKGKQVAVLAWVIGRDAQGVLRSVLQTPTGVQIAKGVELKPGTSKSFILPYVNCDGQRCESSVEMDDDFVREIEAASASTVTATIVASDGRGITFSFPIKGIDKVLAAMASTR